MEKLDVNFLAAANFMSLAASGICGEIPEEIDINKVLKYATEQGIIPLVVSGITKHGKYSNEPIVMKFQSAVLQAVTKNIRDGAFMKTVFEAFRNADIEFAVLKGESIANFYIEPDLRVSGDVDLLVSPECEEKALKLLKTKFGYNYEKRPDWQNETVLRHEKNKLIEVHYMLYDKTREDIFFNNIQSQLKPFINVDTANQGTISALCPDDGVMFVFLHFVKHLLGAGSGLKQIMDIIMYSRHYKEKIDWDDFFAKLKAIKYYHLFEYIITVAVKMFGFPEEDFPTVEYNEENAKKILADIQMSGLFGHNEKELNNFKKVYERERYNTFMSGNYDDYHASTYNSSKLKMIFPKLFIMKSRYKFLVRFPFLLPVAWTMRIFSLVKNLFLKKKNIEKYIQADEVHESEVVKARMELMRELDIV